MPESSAIAAQETSTGPAAPSVSPEDMELIEALSGEVEELLQRVEVQIRELRDYVFALPFDPADYISFLSSIDVAAYQEALRGVNRFVHTIKGNAGFMQLDRLKTYCHRVEELTVGLLGGKLYLEREGYALIEQIPDVIGRFFQRLAEVYRDADVPIDADLAAIQRVQETLAARLGGEEIQLASFQKQDLGSVRKGKTAFKVSLDLGALDRIVADYQGASSTVVGLLQAAGVEPEKITEVTRTLNDHMEQLLVAAQDRMVLTRYQRIVRDLSKALGKDIDFSVTRNAAQARPDVWDHVHNAMVHLVRNAVDHGIETPDERAAAGKPRRGCIELELFEDHKAIHLHLRDNGRGIDPERVAAVALERGAVTAAALHTMDTAAIQKLIFQAGFSTRARATDVSGRGVGMDAVLKEIEAHLGGRLSLHSVPGKGTTIALEIPKSETLAECVLFGDADQTYAIPKVEELTYLNCEPRHLHPVLGAATFYTGAGASFPVLPLLPLLESRGGAPQGGDTVICLGSGARRFGLAVPQVFGHRRLKVERKRGWDAVAGTAALVYGYGLADPVVVVLDVEQLETLALTALERDDMSPPPGTRGDAHG